MGSVMPVLAQATNTPLSLNKAIGLALQNYPSIRTHQAQLLSGKAGLIETKDHRLPSLNLFEQVDAGTSNNLGSAYFSGGIVPSLSGVSARPENSGTVSSGNIGVAYLQWQVSNFGGYKAEIQEASSRIKVDSMDLQKEQFYISSMVLQSYIDLIKNDYLTRVQLENLQRADTIRRVIKNYVVSGLRPGVDSSLADAAYSKAKLDYLDVVNFFRQSKVQLALLTGLDTAAIEPDLRNDDLLFKSFGFLPFRDSSQAFTGASQSYNDSLQATHPFLNYFHSIYENGQAQEKLIRKAYLPKVYVLGAYWMKGSSINANGSIDKDLSSGLGYTRYNYLAGFGITYDLFNLRREKDRLNVQRFQTEAALHRFDEQKLVLTNAALQASVSLNTALNKFYEIPVQLNAAMNAYKQTQAQYNAGLANIIDLTNAFYVLNRAQTDFVNIKDGVWKAIVQKAYAGNGIYQLLSTLN